MTRFFFHFIFILFATNAFSQSGPLRIAVAANARFVVEKLQADFQKKTGIQTEAVTGSSGNLSTQIKNGAPYDLFLSADMDFPTRLYKEGFGITVPKEYALGSLIICSTGNRDLNNWRQLLQDGGIEKIAIANPALAPYGKAAEQALRHYGLWDKLQSKLVLGESVSQVNTYITTGAAAIGFTTEALLHEYPDTKKLKWARIDKNVYEKIRQGVVILKYARQGNYSKALLFYNYLSSPAAKQTFKQYGYQVL